MVSSTLTLRLVEDEVTSAHLASAVSLVYKDISNTINGILNLWKMILRYAINILLMVCKIWASHLNINLWVMQKLRLLPFLSPNSSQEYRLGINPGAGWMTLTFLII